MTGAPQAALIGDGSRLHLQYGPIDLIISVDPPEARERAFRAAMRLFAPILPDLVRERDQLWRDIRDLADDPSGPVARRMVAAARGFGGVFITPMAAVAGAVADEMLEGLRAVPCLCRVSVNNGGDIALWLGPGAKYVAAIASEDGRALGRVDLAAADGIGGIATSGQGGRSLSMGIADSVTVLASCAATADVAATLIANAVDLPGHPAIERASADTLDPDSDLGARLVVTRVGRLSEEDVARALDAGVDRARDFMARGLIAGAALVLRGQARIVGDGFDGR